MFVTKTINYEIYDSIGEDAIADALGNYNAGEDDNGNTISYYDLDNKNRIIFLETLQKQLDTDIAERIYSLRDFSEKEAAATN
jgi:hypothetical protein